MTEAQQGHNKILSLIAEKPQISISALAKQCEVSEKAMRITLERLKAENVIKRVGASFGDIGKSFIDFYGNKIIRIMAKKTTNKKDGNAIRNFLPKER